MRKLILPVLIAGAALTVAGCNRGATNNAVANDLGANMTSEAPANDASAVEAVGNTVEPAPVVNNSAAADVPPPTTNNVESNVSGM
jgi:hypothetical protein